MNKILLTVFLAAVLLTVGCNGPATQESNNNAGNTQTTAAAVEGTQQASTGGGSEQPSGVVRTTRALPVTQTTTAAPSGGALDAIKGLLGSRAKQYMAEYQSTVSVQGQPGYTGTMTFYYKGDGQVRTDMTTNQIETRTYISGGSATTCTKQGGDWSCMKVPMQQGQQDVNKNLDDAQKNIDASPVTPLPDRMIAGVNCKCFKETVTVTSPEKTVWDDTFCLSPEGVPLYTEAVSTAAHSIMEADKYSLSVSDSDFVPPAEPQDLSNLMQGAGGGQMPNLEDLKKGLPSGGE